MSVSRRKFLKTSVVLGAGSLLSAEAFPGSGSALSRSNQGAKILFQGDSITDGGRSRNKDWNHVMGHGYAFIIASRIGFEKPASQYQFFNRGVSGNTVPDLATRWEKDAIELSPDIISILVGVNDTNAEIDGKAGFTNQSYEADLRKLLSGTKKRLPLARLIIGEPFILPVGRVKADWHTWREKIAERQHSARSLASEFRAIFIPYQEHFNEACEKAPADYWIWDGIHPMPAGHELMARKWIAAANL